jgi:hypothetical protein
MPLSEEAVRDMLNRPHLSHGQMAELWGCHRATVEQIRRGITHRKIAPDLPRWESRQTCTHCIHWRAGEPGRCELGFPDPGVEGVKFARECSSWKREATP